MLKFIVIILSIIALIVNGVAKPRQAILTVTCMLLIAYTFTMSNSVVASITCWMVVSMATRVGEKEGVIE